MKKIFCAGAVALAMLGLLSTVTISCADELNYAPEQSGLQTSIDISRIRSALQLTAEQERYWPPVESALRDIAHRQAQQQVESAGLVRRISHRVVSIALDGAAVSRLARVARPLIERLRDDQKQEALALAQEMGLGPVFAALN